MFLTGARMRSTSANAAFSAAASVGLLGSTPSACSTACTLACTTELLAMPTSVVDMLGFLHMYREHRKYVSEADMIARFSGRDVPLFPDDSAPGQNCSVQGLKGIARKTWPEAAALQPLHVHMRKPITDSQSIYGVIAFFTCHFQRPHSVSSTQHT